MIRYIVLVCSACLGLMYGFCHESNIEIRKKAVAKIEKNDILSGEDVKFPILQNGKIVGLITAEELNWKPQQPMMLKTVKMFQIGVNGYLVGYSESDFGVLTGTMDGVESLKLKGNVKIQRYSIGEDSDR